jgi:Spy/CpxP family protein refolding chaperone
MAVLVLSAGVVVGRLSARLAAEPPPPPPGHSPSWLADQLGLSADQRQQIDAIWADVKQQQRYDFEQRRPELAHDRDEAIRDMLTDDQWSEYQEIYEIYREKRQDMDKAQDTRIKTAEERSRALLNDSQKARWDQLAKDMHGHRPGSGSGPEHGQDHGPDHGPGRGFGPTSQWTPDHGPRDGDHP